MSKRTQAIIYASWVGIIGNAFLALCKIYIGFMAGSLAVIGDGIDSTSDIVTSFITLFTANIVARPPSPEYPYGYRRADTIATKVLSFVIFFAGAQLALNTLRRIFEPHPEVATLPELWAVYVTVFSVFAKMLLAFYQYKIGKKVKSAMLIANAKNMQNDVLISIAVLGGLFFSIYLELPEIDWLTALLVSIWIMKVAFEIFLESNTELMDGIKDKTVYYKVFQAVGEVEGAYNPHRTRIRQLGNLYVVELDIEVEASLNISDAHRIGHEVEQSIKHKLDNVYDVIIHLEPLGNIEEGERFGVSEKNI